jgi:antimicrobial peptide system SdpA family protein
MFKTNFMFLSIYVCTFIIIVLVAVLETPSNALNPKYDNRNIAIKLLPQGWGFFTRDPRERDLCPCKVNKDGKLEPLLSNNFRLTNYFGFKRTERIIQTEISTIDGKIPDSLWVEYNGDFERYDFNRLKNCSLVVDNKISKRSIMGDIYIISTQYIPWSWLPLYKGKKIKKPIKVIRLTVK